MRCCQHCFADQVLRKEIELHGRRGDCSFCKSADALVVSPRRLNPFFSPAIKRCAPLETIRGQVFEEADLPSLIDSARDLPTVLERTLYAQIFSHRLNKSLKCRLLDAIRGTRSRRRRSGCKWLNNNDWLPSTECGVKYLGYYEPDDYWYIFERAITSERRYILEQEHDPRWWLEELLPHLAIQIGPGARYWRARLGTRESGLRRPFAASEMGPPPAPKTKAGRMNAEGIPVLYLCESLGTAVNEVRPHLGADVSVVCFETTSSLTVVDLTNRVERLSPFGGSDISKSWGHRNFLRVLNERVSLPVSPFDSAIDYLPTQYVAEFIKHLGYGGILYKSCFSKEHRNLAVFCEKHWPTAFKLAEPPRLFRVEQVNLSLGQEVVDRETYEKAIADEKKKREMEQRWTTAFDPDNIPF